MQSSANPTSPLHTAAQPLAISKCERSAIKRQRPAVLWFTGLSGAGKSTIANLVEVKLRGQGAHTMLLDGDALRRGLCNDLGFSNTDRSENIRRVGEVAKLMTDAGLIAICALISPFRAERQLVRALFESDEFIEVYVDTPLEICIERDPKGLYKKALAQERGEFTGIHQRYEPPENPDIILQTALHSPEPLADRVVKKIDKFIFSDKHS